jgi:hypothetical protein
MWFAHTDERDGTFVVNGPDFNAAEPEKSEPEGRKRESRLDWILIKGGSTTPDPFAPELGLQPFKDFLRVGRDKHLLLLLARRARNRPIETAPSPGWESILYGTFDWKLRRFPFLTRQQHSNSSVQIVARGANGAIDIIGPAGIPDGRADQVIDVTLDRTLNLKIASWDIETTDKRGHWVSAPNANGWWLIKIDKSDGNGLAAGKTRLRLCFPDYGDFERASAFTLRAFDIDGNLVLSQTIQK